MWHLSADTGGTFTDCYAITPTGEERRCKVLSAGCLRSRIATILEDHRLRLVEDWHSNDGLFVGFEIVETAGISACRVTGWNARERVLTTSTPLPKHWQRDTLIELRSHEEAPVLGARLLTQTPLGQAFPPLQFRVATTRATNALLERKGSRVALFITQGFGDLLAIGDQRRAHLFALRHQARPQFHERLCEVPGRLNARGEPLIPLDEQTVHEAATVFAQQGITHAAVALLHSHANAAHEQRVAELLHEAGFKHVSVSSALAPFVKLLPRAQSAVANAYLTGPVQSFLQGISTVLSASSSDPQACSLQVMTSAGGLETAAAIQPKDMLLSGPAGGAIGAANAARRVGYQNIITFDMGGTSTDVARLDGRPGYRFTQSIEGMNLLAPCVAIETVAAGGAPSVPGHRKGWPLALTAPAPAPVPLVTAKAVRSPSPT